MMSIKTYTSLTTLFTRRIPLIRFQSSSSKSAEELHNVRTLLEDKSVDTKEFSKLNSEQLKPLNLFRTNDGKYLPLNPEIQKKVQSKMRLESVIPRKFPALLDPVYPTAEQLTSLPTETQFDKSTSKVTIKGNPRQRLPTYRQKRSLSEVVNRPLPITYPQGIHSLKELVKTNIEALAEAPNTGSSQAKYKYKYFMVSLHRSVRGLHKNTRKTVETLGLAKNKHMVFIKTGPRSAGALLKVKELVKVVPVNTIPPKYKHPKGFSVEPCV